MIEGLHLDVKGSELKNLLDARTSHHADKARFYRQQLDSMKKLDAEMEAERLEMVKTSSGQGPTEAVRASVKKHQDLVAFYTFAAAHIVVDEVYRLAERDLHRIGITGANEY
jgi:hypothetical protein